jgi:hypothetical protein
MTLMRLRKVLAPASFFGNTIDFGGGEAAQYKMLRSNI